MRKWLKEPYRPRKRVQRASVLDPFKGQIMGMLKEDPYSAVQVLTMLRDQGFSGSITIVKDYIQQIRPRSQEAYLTLSFAPGECAQVDWGSGEMIEVGHTRRRLSFFVCVLGYRHGHLSSTAQCFDIGGTTVDALRRFERTGDRQPPAIDAVALRCVDLLASTSGSEYVRSACYDPCTYNEGCSAESIVVSLWLVKNAHPQGWAFYHHE